ncbi:MAG: DUF4347 domain-containing protein [Burkholderiales bacterium]|nr:DUF4347 domain-containing protein [Burkholderiales bacterium]
MPQHEPMTNNAQKLLIIDADVLDAEILLKDRKPGYQVIRLDPASESVTQLSDAIHQHAPVQEIVLVAHATPGQIHFASGLIDSAQLEQHQQQLQAWRKSLSLDAKLCIYGCELAASEEGNRFIELLKEMTGAEVAASSLSIGKTEAGNNWDLDRYTNEFGITMPFHTHSTANYAHTLAPEIRIFGANSIENGSMTFQVKLSEPATDTVRISYRTREELGTALGNNIDFQEGTSFVQIAAGQDTAFISVRTWSDTLDEADESVVIELFNPTNAVFADGVNTLQAIGMILDDDGAGNNLGLFVGNVEIVEGADGVTREVAVPIHLSRPSDQTLTFQYQTSDGSAIAGQDYTAQTGTVTFLPGQTSAAAIIPIIGDAIDEPSETFSLTVTPTPAIANGSAGATGTVTILDGDILPPPEGITVNAGNTANVNEGSLFTRTVSFIDDLDTNADGWTYSVDWGDGSPAETGNIAAGADTFDISRLFADGDASHTVSVTVTDTTGDTDTQQFQLNVNNVAPTIALLGAGAINTGADYTLNLGAITDPGQDTVISYIVNWGDGSSETYNSAGDVTHIYSTVGNTTITVDLVDEDGTHTNAGSLLVAVNTPPAGITLDAGEDFSLNEGSLFNRTILFTDGEDAGADGWTYSVDWGDSSAIENGVIAAGANTFDISRFFADGDASHTVNVTVTDTAGDTDTQQFQLNINNVAPTIAVAGASQVDAGTQYTFNLGAVTDPGDDTVTSYIVNWGDGSSDTFNTAGDVTHTYEAAAIGSNTITVDLVDEDGTHTNAGSLDVTVGQPPEGVSVNAGNNDVLDEGSTLNRTITFTDGEDTGNNGWTYSVDYGDGSAVENGTIAAGANSFDISHVFADGDDAHTISVTVTDTGDATDSDTDSFNLAVNNVAPTIDLLGNDSVNEGEIYTLNLADLIDPGDDTVTSYMINWGDGSATTLSAAELLAAGNAVDHVFADGSSSPQITVDLTDEDDTHVGVGSKTINVNNIAPTIALSGNADADEGSTYTLALGAVTDPGTDTVTDYIIHWGDGSPSISLTAAELAAAGGNVDHVYADGASNPQISVDLVDEDGTHTTAGILDVIVNNVAPTIAVAGASQVDAGTQYTFNLGAVTDPGDDTVSSYIVNWGDGSSDTYGTAGDVTHTYDVAAIGNNTITVDLIDEDGTHTDAGSLNVTVEQPEPIETLLIGNAPLRVSRSDPDAWENAWTVEAVSISHKANFLDTSEAWSSASLNGRNPNVLNGGDIFGGDLGVSGQSLVSSTIRQEIDGTEALRFDLDQAATKVTIDLSRLDGSTANGHFDAGRLQLLDSTGTVVDELVFSADAASHEKQIALDHSAGFSSVVLTAGSYNGADFIFGGLSDAGGQYLSDPQDLGNGTWHASDYLVDAVEFEFGEITLVGTVA